MPELLDDICLSTGTFKALPQRSQKYRYLQWAGEANKTFWSPGCLLQKKFREQRIKVKVICNPNHYMSNYSHALTCMEDNIRSVCVLVYYCCSKSQI